MPNDTSSVRSKRGAGGEDDGNYDEIRHEGYGPGGVAVIVDCMTDNRNRTASEVRHAFTKHGGNLGTDGSVSYMFSKRGIISYGPGADEDTIMEAALRPVPTMSPPTTTVRSTSIPIRTISPMCWRRCRRPVSRQCRGHLRGREQLAAGPRCGRR